MKLLTTILLIGLCLLPAKAIPAQTPTYHGWVQDASTHQPLPGANVYLRRSGSGTTTDTTGYFRFTSPAALPNDTLVVQYVGYRTLRIPLATFRNGQILYLTPRTFTGETVEVEATPTDMVRRDIGVARQSIHFRQIENYGTSEIADVFKLFQAVQLTGNDLDGRRIEIRGSNADEVNVYVDGILINQLGLDFAADLSIIPVETIERLEVLKGANLTLTGSGAFGGVVNITTQRPGNFQASLNVKTGSFNNRYGFGRIQIPLGKKWFVDYSGMYQEYRPTIEYYPEDRFAALDTNRHIFTRKSNHQLNLYTFGQHSEWRAKLWNYNLFYRKPGWRSTRNTLLAAASFKGNVLGSRDWEFFVSTNWNRDNLERVTTRNNRVLSDLTGQQLNARLLKAVTFGGTNSVQLLAEYFHEELSIHEELQTPEQKIPTQDFLLYDNRAALGAVFRFENWVNGDSTRRWLTYLGGRYEVQASGGQYVTNQVGIRYTVTRRTWQWTPYFNFGKNVKLPYLIDNAFAQYLSTQTAFGTLEPEINNGTEIGLEVAKTMPQWWATRWSASIAYFKNITTNKLLRQVGSATEVYYQNGRNVTRGLEITAALKEILGRVDVQAGWIHLNISDRRFYPYKPAQRATLEFRVRPWHGLYLTLAGFYEGTSTAWFVDRAGQFQTVSIAPFRDMDVVLGWRTRVGRLRLNFQAAGYNVFDASGYRQYLLKKQFFQLGVRLWYE